MSEPQWQQGPLPKKKTNIGLIVGMVVGVLALVGGGITALVLSQDKDDNGGGSAAAVAAKTGGDARETAEAFVQAYNSAVKAPDASLPLLREYVCPAGPDSHDYIVEPLKDGTAQRLGLRLNLESVTDAAEEGRAVVNLSATGDGGHASRTTVLAIRTDGRWKVCDPESQMGTLMIPRQ